MVKPRLVKVQVVKLADIERDARVSGDAAAFEALRVIDAYAENVGAEAGCLICNGRIAKFPRKFAVVSLGEEAGLCRAICDQCARFEAGFLTRAATHVVSDQSFPTAGSA